MKTTSRVLLAVSIGTLSSMAQADADSNSGIELLPVTVKTTSAQADSKGFIEDSSLSGTTRNFYSKEDSPRAPQFSYLKDGVKTPKDRRDTWTQGTILNYTSGFTQGAIGVGTEVAVYNEVALERGHARIAGGGNRTLADSDGDAIPQWSKLGLANVKFRASNTTVTAGRQSIDTPVVAYIGNRALPSSFNGFSFSSAELTNLTFVGSTFDRESPRTGAGDEKLASEYAISRSITSDRMSMLGVEYQPLKSLKTSLYASKVEDFWNQYYLGLNHDMGDAKDLEVATAVSYYKSKNTGASKLGTIDNDTYSLSITGTHNAHSLTFAYQENNGNEYFDYVHETNAIYLANSLFSDYNGPNEKSFQIAYGLNMADYGVPGLKFTVYQARGWGIDGTHYHGTGYDEANLNGEHHYEYAIGAGYTLQSGPLKASTVRASYTAHRASANQVDGSLDELRVVTTIPFSIF